MRRKIVYFLCTLLMISPMLTGCATIVEAISVWSQAYTDYADNNGVDPLGIYNQASAWQKNSVGKSLVVADVGASVLELATGKKLSGLKGVIKGTTDDFLKNDLMVQDGNDVAALVGVGLVATGKSMEHLDVKEYLKERDEFLYGEQNDKYFDPNSPDYDPYHFCRYIVDDKNRQIREATQEEMWSCIKSQDAYNLQERTRYDMISSGIISEYEYDELFGNDSLRQLNMDLFREYRFQLALKRTANYYNSNDNRSNSVINNTSSSSSTSSSSGGQGVEIMSSSLVNESEKLDIVEQEMKLATKKIEATIVDLYKFNSFELSEEQKIALDEVVNVMKESKELNITIYGHTCNIGSDKANYNIGMRRAEVAKAYLLGKGIDKNRIKIESKGDLEPLMPNVDKDSREKNRRITFKVL